MRGPGRDKRLLVEMDRLGVGHPSAWIEAKQLENTAKAHSFFFYFKYLCLTDDEFTESLKD